MSGIDYSVLAYPKHRPRVLEKMDRTAQLLADERACRKAVRKRDKGRCFFPSCRAAATELHHIVSRSVRGKTAWRTDDILSACHKHHGYFKAGLVRVEGNPDVAPVSVLLTKLGEEAGMHIPRRGFA